MLTPLRLYIASPDAARLERILSCDSRFFIVGSGQGKQAVGEALRLCPDLLILDAVLSGMDGGEALSLLARLLAPPRVVYLARTAFAPPKPVPDEICSYPCEDRVLLEAVLKAAEHPLPALAQPWEERRLTIAESLLNQLAVPPRLKGRRYMRIAAAALACSPAQGDSYRERLYPYVAGQCGTTNRGVWKEPSVPLWKAPGSRAAWKAFRPCSACPWTRKRASPPTRSFWPCWRSISKEKYSGRCPAETI